MLKHIVKSKKTSFLMAAEEQLFMKSGRNEHFIMEIRHVVETWQNDPIHSRKEANKANALV